MHSCIGRQLPGAACLALVALLALAALPARALSQTTPSTLEPPSGPQVAWAGAFIGGQAAGSLGIVDTTEFVAATGAVFHHFDSLARGGGGGLDLGYDWLLGGGNWRAGVIADINGLADSSGNVFRTMDNLTASVQLRAGFLAAPALLFYGQTGIAAARESIKVSFGGPITEETRAAPGYAIGAGAEWALATAGPRFLAASPSLFADYQHIWWSRGSLQTPAAEPMLNFEWHRQSNVIEAGLRFRL